MFRICAWLCFFLAVFQTARAEDREAVFRWSTEATEADYDRNARRYLWDPTKTYFPRDEAWRTRIFLQSASSRPSAQREALARQVELLSDPAYAGSPDFINGTGDFSFSLPGFAGIRPGFSVYQRGTRESLVGAFAKLDERWSNRPPDLSRFDGLARRWEGYGAPNVVGAKVCAGLFCAPDSPREDVRAVRETFRMMSPFPLEGASMPFISLLPVWRRVMTDPHGPRAALKLARKIMARVSDAEKTGRVEGDLYADAVAAYVEAGADPEQAKAKAIDLLGIYGTRGVDMNGLLRAWFPYSRKLRFGTELAQLVGEQLGGRVGDFLGRQSWKGYALGARLAVEHGGDANAFAGPETYPVVAALATIAAATSYLDSMSLPDRVYSLPAGITSHISYVRPYHFWLSASLAKELKAKGFSTAATVEAVHRIGLAYEIKGGVTTVEPNLLGAHEGYTVETQKDILFNGAGALWGARRGDVALDLDVVADRWRRGSPGRAPMENLAERFQMDDRGTRYLSTVRGWINRLDPFLPLDEWRELLDRTCDFAAVKP